MLREIVAELFLLKRNSKNALGKKKQQSEKKKKISNNERKQLLPNYTCLAYERAVRLFTAIS